MCVEGALGDRSDDVLSNDDSKVARTHSNESIRTFFRGHSRTNVPRETTFTHYNEQNGHHVTMANDTIATWAWLCFSLLYVDNLSVM